MFGRHVITTDAVPRHVKFLEILIQRSQLRDKALPYPSVLPYSVDQDQMYNEYRTRSDVCEAEHIPRSVVAGRTK